MKKLFMLVLFCTIGTCSLADEVKAYHPKIKDEFLRGCVLNESMRNFCECAIDAFPKHATEEEFVKISTEAHLYGKNEELMEVSMKVSMECLEHMPKQ